MMRPLFAYGTLRPGGRYWENIAHCIQDYEPAQAHGFQMYEMPEGYPAIEPGQGTVVGDLLYVRAGQRELLLEIADEIEGYEPQSLDSLYIRLTADVERFRKPGLLIPAYIYVIHPGRGSLAELAEPIAGGDWREHRARLQA